MNLWLRADLDVSASGGNITTWNDQSPNTMHATAFNTPTLIAGANNFNPAVSFARASSEYLDLPDGFANFTSGISTYVVAKPTSVGSFERFIDFGNGQANNNIILARSSTTNNIVIDQYNAATSNGIVTTSSSMNLSENAIYASATTGGSAGSIAT